MARMTFASFYIRDIMDEALYVVSEARGLCTFEYWARIDKTGMSKVSHPINWEEPCRP